MVLRGGGARAGAKADERAVGRGAVGDVGVAGTWPRPSPERGLGRGQPTFPAAQLF